MSDKILITGADGFIGSHLTEFLSEKNYDIRALSYYNSFNNWGWLEHTECLEKIEIVSGDIRDLKFCESIIQDVDIVINLAALIGIPYSYKAPESYIETNVKGTLNLCQVLKNKKIKRFLNTSSSEVYGTAVYVPIDENHPLQPQSPYSASKIGSDAIAMSYYHSFDLPLSVVRPFNTYGPRQSARAIIPNIISQILSGNKEINLGNTSPTRDFTYVKDTCNAFYEILNSSKTIGRTINIGTNTEVSVLDTFNLINSLIGSNAVIKYDENRSRPESSEVERLICDNSLIRKITNFKPKISFEEGLSETIRWFKLEKNLKFYKENIFNI